MEDHPNFDATATPARVELSSHQQTTSAAGDSVNISKEKLKSLKVFDAADNQLKTENVERVVVVCFNCSEEGEYLLAQAHVPNFRMVEIMTFSCTACGYTSRKGDKHAPCQCDYISSSLFI